MAVNPNAAFCSIQLYLIRDVHAKFRIPFSPQSPDIGQNSNRGISNFRISGQSLIIIITLFKVDKNTNVIQVTSNKIAVSQKKSAN